MPWNDRRYNTSSGGANGLRIGIGIPLTPYGTTLSQPGQVGTNLLTSLPRSRESTPAGLGVVAGFRPTSLVWCRAAGFDVYIRFALTTFVANHRGFAGLRGATAQIGAVEPSTLVDVIGMRFDTLATAWSLVHADGVSAQTVAAAVGNVTANDVIELRLTGVAGANTIAYRVRNLTAGTTAGSGTLASNLPAASTFLGAHVHVDTSLDATAAAQPDLVDVFAEAAVGV